MQNFVVVNTVRARKISRDRRFVPRFLIMLVSVLLVAAGGLLICDFAYGSFGFFAPKPNIESQGSIRVIKVPPGGNLQAAVDIANGGDVIELQAGAVYAGTITLPAKEVTEFITIRSSGAAALPPNQRVSPAQRGSMATIAAGLLSRPAVTTAKGAHHYKFVGIEFTATSSTYNYGLVVLGRDESATDLPHDIEIDRCYVHPYKTGVIRRGVAVNSAKTIIKNSYIEGFGFESEETQGIAGWTGTRDVEIINNYVEGGAENILFGGADPASAELIPRNIEIRGNHLNKPEAWSQGINVKTLFELKNAKNVNFTGNYLTNNWMGEAFRITVRNQDGKAPFSTIEDVVIKDNIIDGAGAGFNILGKDYTYPSQVIKRIQITNNLLVNIGPNGKFQGRGYFVQINDGEDISITRNTSLNSGSIASMYEVMPRNFVVSDNILSHGDYGVHGLLSGVRSAEAQKMYRGNIVTNLVGVPPSDYSVPAGNLMVQNLNEIGFADAAAKDYRLSVTSRFKGKGSDLPPR